MMNDAVGVTPTTMTLEQRRASALDAFNSAFQEAAVGGAELCKDPNSKAANAFRDDLFHKTVILFHYPAGMNDIALMGPISRSRLLTLAGRLPGGSGPRGRCEQDRRNRRGARPRKTDQRHRAVSRRPAIQDARIVCYEHYAAWARTRSHIELFRPLDDQTREAILAIRDFLSTAPDSANPSAKWLKEADPSLRLPGSTRARAVLTELIALPGFEMHDLGPLSPLLNLSFASRRGLVWLCSTWPASEITLALVKLARRAFSPFAGKGMANEKMGNACLWSLSQIETSRGLPALARIRESVRYPVVRQRISALVEKAGQARGRLRAEIEEEIAPLHGFDAQGVSTYELEDGIGRAEVRLDDHGKPQCLWRDEAGEALKAAFRGDEGKRRCGRQGHTGPRQGNRGRPFCRGQACGAPLPRRARDGFWALARILPRASLHRFDVSPSDLARRDGGGGRGGPLARWRLRGCRGPRARSGLGAISPLASPRRRGGGNRRVARTSRRARN